jgi:hypothetical protein
MGNVHLPTLILKRYWLTKMQNLTFFSFLFQFFQEFIANIHPKAFQPFR